MANKDITETGVQEVLRTMGIPSSFKGFREDVTGRAEALATVGSGMAGTMAGMGGGLFEMLRSGDPRAALDQYRQTADFARDLSDKLTEYGVDGFTFVTDARVADMPARQAGMAEEAVAGINGLRFQYIPEFDVGADAWAAMSPAERAAKIDEMEELFDDIAADIEKTEPGISSANMMHYETNVIERDQYDGLLGTTPATQNR